MYNRSVMLFTITYTGENAADLGYLLHKNPSRPQTACFNFGKVHVFYPEVNPRRCTAALLLDIDPLDLVRGRTGVSGGSAPVGLFDYVNDRPYVASSFMSTAISRVYGTAMAGRCEKRQELADAALDLSASLVMLPCRGGEDLPRRIFEPLGYTVAWNQPPLDEKFPEWGNGPYVNLRISGTVRLRDLLRHIYVLIPVFDFRKHYWVGEDEVEKLLSHGEGWLENHPEKNVIARRYFKKISRLSRLAIDRLDNGEGGAAETEEPETGADADAASADSGGEPASGAGTAGYPLRLNNLRLLSVFAELKASDAETVIDLGCGEGNLLQLLLKEKRFTALAGTDVSLAALNRAAERLKLDELSEEKKKRINLFQSSLTYRDKRITGYDAATVVEVIEHLDQDRLAALAAHVFGGGFKTIIITTPNIEYNINYPGLAAGRFRHPDHRFEWTRAQFRAWGDSLAAAYGYAVRYEDVGLWDETQETPTQMGVFSK